MRFPLPPSPSPSNITWEIICAARRLSKLTIVSELNICLVYWALAKVWKRGNYSAAPWSIQPYDYVGSANDSPITNIFVTRSKTQPIPIGLGETIRKIADLALGASLAAARTRVLFEYIEPIISLPA